MMKIFLVLNTIDTLNKKEEAPLELSWCRRCRDKHGAPLELVSASSNLSVDCRSTLGDDAPEEHPVYRKIIEVVI